ncbi:MarR family winged helix-turn-helix transcriptional regulator [Williamsia sterculiae]|uniref:Transcriptional regulator, MarR family n=1 Tax=Williamsia sterculiae TaxID=1344003 RepID=A0A1N7DWB3_9NOCA|nr:MarR family transcriptional regulator [Williamsia sterculiae]SIR80110.1 transcriptional regulator, MarR family [Williamsia sterculiae]
MPEPEHEVAPARDQPTAAVWRSMVALVFDRRDDWRRSVAAATGLPFSRIRILRRVADRAMPLKELAAITGMDAPATSVAVTDLEDAGLVRREQVDGDRRCKQVTITDAGRAVLSTVAEVDDPPPPGLRNLDDADLEHLRRLLTRITEG